MNDRKLTIGIYVYDDYDGVRYLIDSIRINNPEILSNIEFVIIDNCPDTTNSNALMEFLTTSVKNVAFNYVAYGRYPNHAYRFEAIELAKTPYVLVTESKTQFTPGSLKSLIDFFDSGMDEGRIITGPRIKDDFSDVMTHFKYEWNGEFYGVAEKDPRVDSQVEPFEIEGILPGVFAIRKADWRKISRAAFASNGAYAEDVVLSMRKFLTLGKRPLCLPTFKWTCRMIKTNGKNIPDSVLNRFHNYATAFLQLGLNDKLIELKTQYAEKITNERMDEIISKCKISLAL